ncbi:caspase family protein [bacterium]|nr:caspase family protein [bacterium]
MLIKKKTIQNTVKMTLCFGFVILACVTGLNATERGVKKEYGSLKPSISSEQAGDLESVYTDSYALLIGVGEYTNGWSILDGVKNDIEAVKEHLNRKGFKTVTIMNPDSNQLKETIDRFIEKFGMAADNRLLFYYAGHGHTEKQAYGEETGYIVPVDAPDPEQDRAGFLAKAIDMRQIEVYAKKIQSKHALFMFDSCFSGTIFTIPRGVEEKIDLQSTLPVRQFITSGRNDETVPDHSIFREQFISALNGEGDLNNDGVLTGSELGRYLKDRVEVYSSGAQHPQYGKIKNPYLDKGEFLFAVKKTPLHNNPAGADADQDLLDLTRDNSRDVETSDSNAIWHAAAIATVLGFGWMTLDFSRQYEELGEDNDDLESRFSSELDTDKREQMESEYSENQDKMKQLRQYSDASYTVAILALAWEAYLLFFSGGESEILAYKNETPAIPNLSVALHQNVGLETRLTFSLKF